MFFLGSWVLILSKYKKQSKTHSTSSACQLTLIALLKFWLVFELKTSSYYLWNQIFSPFTKCQWDHMTLKRIELARGYLVACLFK